MTPLFSTIRSFEADFLALEGLIEKSIPRIHPMISKYACSHGLSAADAASMIRKNATEACSKVQTRNSAIGGGEGKEIHKLWLTSLENPSLPSPNYISRYAKNAHNFTDLGWSLNIWVQNSQLISAEIDAICKYNSKINIRFIDDLPRDGAWRSRVDIFIKDKKFPFAADIVRMKILQEFGGIYLDMGVFFKDNHAPDLLIKNFEYSMIFWENLFYQNSLLMMPRDSELAKKFFKVVDDPYSVPFEMLGAVNGITEGYLFSGVMITILLMEKIIKNESIDICPLMPNGEIIEWTSQQSWYKMDNNGEAKFGNAYVPDSSASFLSEKGWLDRS